MTLYPGPMRHGVHNHIQNVLLRVAFAMQDIGEAGRRFEDWVAPAGHRATPQPVEEPYWRQP